MSSMLVGVVIGEVDGVSPALSAVSLTAAVFCEVEKQPDVSVIAIAMIGINILFIRSIGRFDSRIFAQMYKIVRTILFITSFLLWHFPNCSTLEF